MEEASYPELSAHQRYAHAYRYFRGPREFLELGALSADDIQRPRTKSDKVWLIESAERFTLNHLRIRLSREIFMAGSGLVRPISILIVEDDEGDQHVIKRMLQRSGLQCRFELVSTLREAQLALRKVSMVLRQCERFI